MINEALVDAEIERLELIADLKRTEKFRLFQPYVPQMEFFAQGPEKRERMIMAGTQCGKTEAGAFEATCHLTGIYPKWWPGKRFNHPTRGWAGGEGGTLVKDVLQNKLCGTPGDAADYGTGMIPKSLLLGRTLSHGVTDAFETIRVRHASGGTSVLGFKSYDQGRTKWQSATLDWVWLDEEPPDDIYTEAVARLTGQGLCFVTCTPLQGPTTFIRQFWPRPSTPDRGLARMGLKHVSHFTEEEKQKRIASYPAWQRAARENGDPVLEGGAIFVTPETDIQIKTQPGFLDHVPAHWTKLWGIDFGGASNAGHPFAAALTAYDRETDVFYVLRVLRMKGTTPVIEADAMKKIAINVPVAWPHDGTHTQKGTGKPMADLYRAQGLNMLSTHAVNDSGDYYVFPALTEMDVAMRSGKFKAYDTCTEFFEEYRTYRVDEDGKIVAIDDDVLSAVRYAWMMRKKGKAVPLGGKKAELRRPTSGGQINPWSGRPEYRR